ncbi:unnamed protein product [Rotaria sordida]|uniref:Tc1-like transposase DDE domain-containing protein n=1 Tax=Rotaria sordida TaxID=392033 RepID=A0A814M0B6_9BILA|nr:unnamed protein product [Rotaria sordida]CAF1258710.1 unnamed protein product [Rotaria sordida]
MDIEPDNDGGDSDYNGESRCSGFRPGAGRKRKTLSSSIQMMVNERRQRAVRRQEISKYKAQLRQWINDIKWSHQGVPSTYCDNTTALLVIFNLMLENVDLTQTEAVAKADTKGGSLGNQSTELFMSLPHFIITTIMDRRAEEHGITSDGLLHEIDSSTNKTISAELIYEAKNPFGDYQFNMDGYNFRLWVDQHLFSVFEAKYGYDKRMILVLDNAPYHKEQGEGYVNIKSMSKIDMINLVLSKKVHSIVIIRNGQAKMFEAGEWHMNGPSGPYKEELQVFMERSIKQYPDLQKTLLEKLFEHKSLPVKPSVPDFHYFVLIPPYTPQLQTIEWIWSYVKGYAAKQFMPCRTVQQLIEQTRAGFYGDDGEHDGISTEMVRNMIAHAHKYCDLLIDDNPLLERSINNLKNVKNYEGAYEEEENEDEADDINIEIDDNIE